jgi:hypothetical protein
MNRERSETNTVAPLGEHVCLTKELTLGFGRNAKDNRPHSRTLTFADLIQELRKPDVARGALTSAEYHLLDKAEPIQKSRRNQEKDGPYFVACHLRGDGRRCNENADRLCGIALDFDSGKTTKDDIQRLLTGYAFVAYTTYSHRAELEKWRVFVPYKESVTRNSTR